MCPSPGPAQTACGSPSYGTVFLEDKHSSLECDLHLSKLNVNIEWRSRKCHWINLTLWLQVQLWRQLCFLGDGHK